MADVKTTGGKGLSYKSDITQIVLTKIDYLIQIPLLLIDLTV